MVRDSMKVFYENNNNNKYIYIYIYIYIYKFINYNLFVNIENKSNHYNTNIFNTDIVDKYLTV